MRHLGTLKTGLYTRFGELEDQGCTQFGNLNKQHPPVLSPVSFGRLSAWRLMVVIVVSTYLNFLLQVKGVKELNLLTM